MWALWVSEQDQSVKINAQPDILKSVEICRALDKEFTVIFVNNETAEIERACENMQLHNVGSRTWIVKR